MRGALAQRAALARKIGAPLIATNDVAHARARAARARRRRSTCIREKTTLEAAGRLTQANAERHLKSADEMARLFAEAPRGGRGDDPLPRRPRIQPRRTRPRLSRRNCARASRAPQAALEAFAEAGARARYPDGVPDARRARRSTHELALIAQAQLRPLFPHRARHRALRALARHSLPGPRLGGQFGGLLLPRNHRGRSRAASIFCSSASSRPSATSRPTSTSISSTSGARR